jgi:hypothetical protein
MSEMSDFEDVVVVEEKPNKGHWDPEQEHKKDEVVGWIEKTVRREAKQCPRFREIMERCETLEEVMREHTKFKKTKAEMKKGMTWGERRECVMRKTAELLEKRYTEESYVRGWDRFVFDPAGRATIEWTWERKDND